MKHLVLRPGMVRHGGDYEAPSPNQDWVYKDKCDRLMAERAKKAKAA